MPGGAVGLLSAMLSVEDIAKAPQARMSLTGGPQKRHGEAPVQWSMPGVAVGQRAQGLHGTASTLRTGWGIITGATQMTIHDMSQTLGKVGYLEIIV